MEQYKHYMRSLAAACYTHHNGNIRLATKEFTEKWSDLGCKAPKHPAAYVKHWGQKQLQDPPGAGRPGSSGHFLKWLG